MKNIFGMEISPLQEIATEMHTVLLPIMQNLMRYIGISDNTVAETFLQFAREHEDVYAYEREAHRLLQSRNSLETLTALLQRRSELMYQQIKPHLVGTFLLDFGCGDGKIGEMIAKESYNVRLADVYQHPHITKTGLDFELLDQEGHILIPDNSFDNTLVLTVLHHSLYPLQNIAEVARVTKPNGRVIVIESVYDVQGTELTQQQREKSSHFLRLTAEQQRKACAFFDHFFNRVFYFNEDPDTKVAMPYNYNTPFGWRNAFSRYRLKERTCIHLGIDQPLGPAEYHTLHILEKM
ncbi:MAG: class I SAM-dependent methyltransferase [Candidatus Woesearchaeota archaeon]|jgi:ubiquinone/menaquinone biosynthesis C-methylase UbiE